MIVLWILSCASSVTSAAQHAEVQRVELANGLVAEFELQPDKQANPIRHGALTVIDNQGNKRVVGEFSSGKRSGRWRFSYANRKSMASGAFKDGSRSGEWKFSHPNGEPQARGRYVRGHPKGKWRFWTEDGEDDSIHTGTYDWVSNHDLGTDLRGSGPTLDGTLHGNWVVTWPTGHRQLEATFKRGERAGAWRFWHVDGTLDPEFLSGDRGTDTWNPAIVQDPISLSPVDPDGPADIDTPTDLTAIAQHLDLDSIDPELRLEYESCSQGERSPEELLDSASAHRREGLLLLVLEELQALDFESTSDLERARQLNDELVREILGGRSYVSPVTPNADALRLAALRLHSLHAVTAALATWWEFDLDLGLDGDGWPSSSLLDPTTHVEGLLGRHQQQELYASRFARRDPLGRRERKALDLALKWLVEHQDADGKWDSDEFTKHCDPWDTHEGAGAPVNDLGVTALALLAVLGDGNAAGAGPYREDVQRAALWLCSQQDTKDGLFGERIGHDYIYQHLIATLALSELCAQSNSRGLRDRLQLALKFITSGRHQTSGWRYEVPSNGKADTSVTGWALLALAAAAEAGLAFDPANLNFGLAWMDSVTDPKSGRVGYMAPGERSSRIPGKNDHFSQDAGEAMTAITLHCRHLLGQAPSSSPVMLKHAQMLTKNLPTWNPEEFMVDYYYWFHGTYAMHYFGGKLAVAWRKSLLAALLEGQQPEGSWPPSGAWSMIGGRVYSTALCALMLETPRRHSRIPQARQSR